MNMKKLFLLNLPYLLFVYPFDMCGGFCNSYCHDDYREVGL